MRKPILRSTISGREHDFAQLEEFTQGESLEVVVPEISSAKVQPGGYIWQRFQSFLPFQHVDEDCSLGEGNTPMLRANAALQQLTGLRNLLLKDETQNPTWSFKDRGSLTCMLMARELGEDITATISTGNMGHSIAAYAARCGVRALVFIPHFTPEQKIQAIAMHGAIIIRVASPDYAVMKSAALELATELKLRIVSGNGPIRTEGYKLTSFEMWEQMEGRVPDYIAVPTSACGHVRGLWKGWNELRQAGLIDRLPKMIIVQAAINSPIVTAWKKGLREVVPFTNFHTVAEAITSGNPLGGNEILHKAYEHGWLAADATEEEILDAQRQLARAGHFVEPAAAASLHAVRKLRVENMIKADESVVLMLTGSGLKDMDVLRHHGDPAIIDTDVNGLRRSVKQVVR